MKWSRNMIFCAAWTVLTALLLLIAIISGYFAVQEMINGHSGPRAFVYILVASLTTVCTVGCSVHVPQAVGEFVQEHRSNKRAVKNKHDEFIKYCKDKY
ncbi:hypothetical protein [Cronobacter phage vB_Cdu_VP8]|nr:hypothetical protein [Cronobacter phage vB_Cdu_VP8]